METKTMTKEQAIAEGFTLWGWADEQDQILQKIEHFSEEDVSDHKYRVAVLAEKTPNYPSISGEDIFDMVSDRVCDNAESGGDTGDIEDMIKGAVDWEDISGKINEALKKRPYYYLTDIKLTL